MDDFLTNQPTAVRLGAFAVIFGSVAVWEIVDARRDLRTNNPFLGLLVLPFRPDG